MDKLGSNVIKARLHIPHQGFSSQVDLSDLGGVLGNKHAVLWLDLLEPSPEDMDLLRREFGFHELALEDAALPHERPKLDEYDQFYFLVFYSLSLKEGFGLELNELDLFVGENYLVAVHKTPIPEIDEVLRRWERNDILLGDGVGALVYALLDELVDNYFRVSDKMAEQVAELEQRLLEGTDQKTLQAVFVLKKRLLALRRVLSPERDVLNVLMRRDLPLLDRKTLLYLRDVYDHLARIIDAVDLQSDLLTSVLDVHLSSVSNKLNQVMKTLTSVTIILMTMALIAGVYGMNFRNMPELEWPLGYVWALFLMASSGIGLYLLLRKKDWI